MRKLNKARIELRYFDLNANQMEDSRIENLRKRRIELESELEETKKAIRAEEEEINKLNPKWECAPPFDIDLFPGFRNIPDRSLCVTFILPDLSPERTQASEIITEQLASIGITLKASSFGSLKAPKSGPFSMNLVFDNQEMMERARRRIRIAFRSATSAHLLKSFGPYKDDTFMFTFNATC